MIDAIILCGGKGTRVRHINPRFPKVLFPINNRPFLDFVLANLYFYGYRRFILATGYLKERIKEYADKSPLRKHIIISSEPISLGTAGAIKKAERYIVSDDFLVLNGDSLVKGNILELAKFHSGHQSLATIGLVKPDGRTDVGNININKKFLVVSFNEKEKSQRYTNAGIYLFNRHVFSIIPKGYYSLEEKFFPSLVGLKSLYGFPMEAKVIDIGTEERYRYVSE